MSKKKRQPVRSRGREQDQGRARAKIIEKLAEGWSLGRAAKAGGVHRRTMLRWRDEDQAFDEACLDAVDEGTDGIEDIALNQAKRGNGVVTMFLLNARRPEKFKRKPEPEDIRPVTFTLSFQGNKVRSPVDVPEAGSGDIQSEGQFGERRAIQFSRSIDQDG